MSAAIRTLLCGLFFSSIASVHATEPKFSLTPLTRTEFLVAIDETVTVRYRVLNNTDVTRTLTMVPIDGITQMTVGSNICSNPFILAPGQSCLLTLSLFGGELPPRVNTGPKICKTQPNTNTPDPFLCSQPSRLDSLNITRVEEKRPILFTNTSLLPLTAGGQPGNLTITNGSSIMTAHNVKADLSGTALSFNVTQDSSDCDTVLPDETCTLTFTPNSNAVSLTEIPIRGDNTRTIGSAIVVAEPETSALIRVTNSPLILTANAIGSLTIKNNSQTLSASGIQAHSIPAGITQDASNCINTPVPPGGTCTLRFTASTYGVPAFTTLIFGSDTSQTQAALGVDAPPLLDIAFVGGSSLTLRADGTNTGTMTIENISGKIIDAGVTAHFEGTALSGNVTATTCPAMNDGDTCTITFTAGRTSVPTATTFPIYKTDTTTTLTGTMTINPSPVAYLSSARSNDIYQCIIEANTNNFIQCQTFSNLGVNTPYGIAINPEKTRAYIVNNGNNSVSQCDIEPNTNYLINCKNANANGLNKPNGIAINSAGTNAYITNRDNNTVSRCPIHADGGFAASCVDSGAKLLSQPRGIAFKADNSFAYITNFANVQIIQCKIDTNDSLSSCATVYQGTNEQFIGIAINTLKNRIYSAGTNASNLLTCTLVNGGGLENCITTSMDSTSMFRAAGVAVNTSGTIEYITNSEPAYSNSYTQCLLKSNGDVQSCVGVKTAPLYLWGIALLE